MQSNSDKLPQPQAFDLIPMRISGKIQVCNIPADEPAFVLAGGSQKVRSGEFDLCNECREIPPGIDGKRVQQRKDGLPRLQRAIRPCSIEDEPGQQAKITVSGAFQPAVVE